MNRAGRSNLNTASVRHLTFIPNIAIAQAVVDAMLPGTAQR